MITRNFNLYLNAGHSVPLVINVNQYDQGEQWVFTLYNSDGTQYTPSTGAIVGIKSDGLGIINSGSVVDGKVVINETQQMTAAVGKAVFELLIDSQTHGTANFVVLVEEKPGNNADLSESDLSLLQEAIDATSPLPTGGSVGQVLTKTANGSTWSNAGTPTQEQVADAVSDWADEHITVETGVVIDTSLAVAGAAADSKKVGDEITDLKSAIQQGGSFNAEVKAALDQFTASVLQLAEKVAYIDENGQDYYDDIDDAADALHSAMYPPVNLVSISAVYTQSGTIYDTDSLDDLKADLVVTAHFDNSTSRTISNYVLSGTLTVGTSTIIVTYGEKTTTFNVTVVSSLLYELSQETTLTGSNYISTEVQLLNEDKDFTILYDVTGSSSQVNGATFIHCMYEANPWPGIVVQLYGSSAYTRFIAFDSGEFKFNTTIKGNRQKCAITHEAGSNTYNITYFDGTNIVNGSKTATSFTAITNPVVIGAQLTTSNTYTKYFAGTVHDFKIYASVLSSATINEYVGG